MRRVPRPVLVVWSWFRVLAATSHTSKDKLGLQVVRLSSTVTPLCCYSAQGFTDGVLIVGACTGLTLPKASQSHAFAGLSLTYEPDSKT